MADDVSTVPDPDESGVRRSATIYDIARVTGVNASTVSRALNKPGRINAVTEQRIRSAAESLGYRLNPIARALHSGKTGTVALIVSDITNPVFFDLIRGAEHGVAQAGLTLVLSETHGLAEREFETAQRLLPAVDGLVLVASGLADRQILELASRKPLVLANRLVDGVPGFAPKADVGMDAAVAHLAELGHTSIAFLSGPRSSWISDARWHDLLDHATRQGMAVHKIAPGPATFGGGADGLRGVLASGTTAVHTYNDLMAIGLLQACREAGVAVPEDLSIVGFDDIFGASFTNPALTTIRAPLRELGQAAIRHLSAMFNETAAQPPVTLPTELVIRESTGPASRTRR